jgi:hypothetical protein
MRLSELGNGLRVHGTTPLRTGSFIPFAQPFASKLLGLALTVADRDPVDAVLGWYYEPYGLVAAHVGRARNLPYVLRHAGSDLGRLAGHPDLGAAYRSALEDATALVVTNEPEFEKVFGRIERPRIRMRRPSLPAEFTDRADALDMPELLAAADVWLAASGLPSDLTDRVRDINTKSPRPGIPTIGIYGKVATTKGSYDLLAALGRLARDHAEFSFLSLSSGHADDLRAYYEAILGCPPLAERTWVLPPITPWRVPSFLHACNIVCCLERSFSIPFHGPLIPHEVLSSGACLLCSAEIANKRSLNASLVHGRNAVIVQDPTDHDGLAAHIRRLLTEPDYTFSIGHQGRQLAQFWNDDLPRLGDVVNGFAAALVI